MQDKQQLIKAFYTTAGRSGLDGKSIIKDFYNATSAKQLSAEQLQHAIKYIGEQSHTWRRRVMAAIGGYLRKSNKESNANIIKAIACRAAKADDFNKIPIETLRRLYNQFSPGNTVSYKQSDLQRLATLN